MAKDDFSWVQAMSLQHETFPLYEEYIKRLEEVNDESKSEEEHKLLAWNFTGWCDGVAAATGQRFNGDHYYLDKVDRGEMEERPMCCGQFLDWEHKG